MALYAGNEDQVSRDATDAVDAAGSFFEGINQLSDRGYLVVWASDYSGTVELDGITYDIEPNYDAQGRLWVWTR